MCPPCNRLKLMRSSVCESQCKELQPQESCSTCNITHCTGGRISFLGQSLSRLPNKHIFFASVTSLSPSRLFEYAISQSNDENGRKKDDTTIITYYNLVFYHTDPRLAPSLFRGISALRNIVTSAGVQTTKRTLRRKKAFLRSVLFVVYVPAEAIFSWMLINHGIDLEQLYNDLDLSFKKLLVLWHDKSF